MTTKRRIEAASRAFYEADPYQRQNWHGDWETVPWEDAPESRRQWLMNGMDAALAAAEAAAWEGIESAPKLDADADGWIIGAVEWGKEGRVHTWSGPCQWYGDHWEFVNHDFDVFPQPTHWRPLPSLPGKERG